MAEPVVRSLAACLSRPCPGRDLVNGQRVAVGDGIAASTNRTHHHGGEDAEFILVDAPDFTPLAKGETSWTHPLSPFAGRLLIGLPFAMIGPGKLAAFGTTTSMIAAAGLPVPPLAYVVAVALELGGGFCDRRLPSPPRRTRRWQCSGGSRVWHSTGNFATRISDPLSQENVMMAGGLLQIAAFGAGRSVSTIALPRVARLLRRSASWLTRCDSLRMG